MSYCFKFDKKMVQNNLLFFVTLLVRKLIDVVIDVRPQWYHYYRRWTPTENIDRF